MVKNSKDKNAKDLGMKKLIAGNWKMNGDKDFAGNLTETLARFYRIIKRPWTNATFFSVRLFCIWGLCRMLSMSRARRFLSAPRIAVNVTTEP